ncbi:MAG: hypothetical protein ACYS8K_09470, partial [Planctomycetota bacterium]
WIAIAAVSACLMGCDQLTMRWQPPVVLQPAPGAAAAQPKAAAPGKAATSPAEFIGPNAVDTGKEPSGRGAVDAAVELSQKYARVTEELLDTQKANKQLADENNKLLEQVATLEVQLAKSRKELEEADEMLVELGNELREWKNNVMAFRKELLDAHNVQMNALLEIMKVLNGETPAPKGGNASVEGVGVKDASGESAKTSNG